MILDEIRSRYPAIGLGLFCMEPGQPVTLETYVGDQVYSFTADTVAGAIAKAFPEAIEPEPPETDWEKLGRAQSRKLQAVLHIPGVKEALAELKWTDEPDPPAPTVFD